MCFDHDSPTAHRADRGRGAGQRRADAAVGGRDGLHGVRRARRRTAGRRDDRAARCPRTAPVLRGPRAPIRGARDRCGRDRLLRADRGSGSTWPDVRVPAPRHAAHLGRPGVRHPGRGGAPALGRGRRRSRAEHHRLLHRRADRVPHGDAGHRPHGRHRLLRLADRAAPLGPARAGRCRRPRCMRGCSRSSAARTRRSARTSGTSSRRRCAAANVDHQVITYPGAPHSFFDRKADEFAATSDKAWREVLTFIGAREASSV